MQDDDDIIISDVVGIFSLTYFLCSFHVCFFVLWGHALVCVSCRYTGNCLVRSHTWHGRVYIRIKTMTLPITRPRCDATIRRCDFTVDQFTYKVACLRCSPSDRLGVIQLYNEQHRYVNDKRERNLPIGSQCLSSYSLLHSRLASTDDNRA